MEVAADAFRSILHYPEDACVCADQFVLGDEVPIVGSVPTCVLPHPLRRVKFRRVRRQLVNFQPMSIRFEP